MLSIRKLISAALVPCIVVVGACGDGEDVGQSASALRNDGLEEGASNPNKLTCASHGITGATTVDLGGVDRTLDLGGGATLAITNAHAGPDWRFDWAVTGGTVSLILVRSGNKDSYVAFPATSSGHVDRDDVTAEPGPYGGTKPGLNRIAVCFTPTELPCDEWHPCPPDCEGADKWDYVKCAPAHYDTW